MRYLHHWIVVRRCQRDLRKTWRVLFRGVLCQLQAPNFELEKREIRRTSYSLRERAILRLNMY